MKIRIYMMFLLCCFLFVTQISAQDETIQKCQSSVKGGEYILTSAGHTIEGEKVLLILIVVKSQNINRDFMLKLAERLKSEYCNEKKLQAVIFDDRKLADISSISKYVESEGKTILMRGYYSFDRTSGKEEIEFSAKRGNSTDEIKIDLSSINDQVDCS